MLRATGKGQLMDLVEEIKNSKMKPTLITSSFRYEKRGHGKTGTRAGGGRRKADGDGASTASGEEEDGDENEEVTSCMKVCIFQATQW